MDWGGEWVEQDTIAVVEKRYVVTQMLEIVIKREI